jgi:hypothetical protein
MTLIAKGLADPDMNTKDRVDFAYRRDEPCLDGEGAKRSDDLLAPAGAVGHSWLTGSASADEHRQARHGRCAHQPL